MVELYTKRNFRCDCGNSKMKRGCDLEKNKDTINSNNTYNHNYKGICFIIMVRDDKRVKDCIVHATGHIRTQTVRRNSKTTK